MKSIGGYALSILLIPIYVNLFSLWKTLNGLFPPLVMLLLPICATLVLAVFSFLYFLREQKKNKKILCRPFLLAGIIICMTALALPDPNYPVKRIHVAEYMILALIVRYAMSQKLNGIRLLFFSACFASILGIHDEFLQGLHPSRTYGLRDMSVNTLGAWGGALIWHGLGIFSLPPQTASSEKGTGTTVSLLYLLCLLTGVLALVIPMMFYKASHFIPLWPSMILFGSLVFYSSYVDQFRHDWKHGITAVSGTAFCLLFYVAVPRVSAYTFF
ncbi:VanZ family protein [Desulfopila sp. IMCC35008]|uniref:VanZ family protein n=1 Tax=Desulfopila sp. IMCC35008 TaxID=2653858 RepID=UPI0013D34F3A|nr:VanZ family protein [Desulfopila sp. IMCC35008]